MVVQSKLKDAQPNYPLLRLDPCHDAPIGVFLPTRFKSGPSVILGIILTCLNAEWAEVGSENAGVTALVPARVNQPPLPGPEPSYDNSCGFDDGDGGG